MGGLARRRHQSAHLPFGDDAGVGICTDGLRREHPDGRCPDGGQNRAVVQTAWRPVVNIDAIAAAAARQLPEISPERRAMILYTSGTTSKPKGVVTTHANIQAQIESLVQAWEWSATDR